MTQYYPLGCYIEFSVMPENRNKGGYFNVFPQSTVIKLHFSTMFHVHNCKREIKYKKIRLPVIRINKKNCHGGYIYTHTYIYIIFIRNINMHALHN